jgi:hypothetical protein
MTYNPMRELTPITAKTKKARALDVEELRKWIDAQGSATSAVAPTTVRCSRVAARSLTSWGTRGCR